MVLIKQIKKTRFCVELCLHVMWLAEGVNGFMYDARWLTELLYKSHLLATIRPRQLLLGLSSSLRETHITIAGKRDGNRPRINTLRAYGSDPASACPPPPFHHFHPSNICVRPTQALFSQVGLPLLPVYMIYQRPSPLPLLRFHPKGKCCHVLGQPWHQVFACRV